MDLSRWWPLREEEGRRSAERNKVREGRGGRVCPNPSARSFPLPRIQGKASHLLNPTAQSIFRSTSREKHVVVHAQML